MELLELVLGLPLLVMDLAKGLWEFYKQPNIVKAQQLGKGIAYIILAIVLSPCACCIFLIQGVAG